MRSAIITVAILTSGFLVADWYRESQEPVPAPASYPYSAECSGNVGPCASVAPGTTTGGAR